MAGSPFTQLAARIAQQRGPKVNTNQAASAGGGGGGYYDRLPPAPPTGAPGHPTYRVPLMPANPKQGRGRFSLPLQVEHGIGREPAYPRRSRV